MPEDWRLLELIQNNPDNKYFDIKKTKQTEQGKDIVLLSLNEAMDDFAKQKSEGKNMTWGGYKPLHIYHMTRIPAFSRMDVPADGCPDAINATGFSFGPSWRMVISLEDKVKGYAVYPGGQSGNPASKYYNNMIDAWIKGEYYDLNIHAKAEELKSKSHTTITLNPQS